MGVKSWSKEVLDNRLFTSVNMQVMSNSHISLIGNKQMDAMLNVLFSQCDYFNLSMPDWRHGKAELALKEKNQNLLEIIVNLLTNL